MFLNELLCTVSKVIINDSLMINPRFVFGDFETVFSQADFINKNWTARVAESEQ